MSRSSTRLSDRDQAIVTTVERFRQVSSAHVLRLHFADNSPKSRKARMTRTMNRLYRWGQLSRIPRAVGGWSGGSEGYIYTPTTSRARIPDPHTLDITETYVRLEESPTELLAFDPEPYCHRYVGHVELKPDGFVDIRNAAGRYRFFIEVDRGSEWRHQLGTKLRRYCQAYKQWDEPTFPLVVWIVQDEVRARLLQSVIRRAEYPELFTVQIGNSGIDVITSAGLQ